MQRVTLLIPTFNRSKYLARQLNFLSQHYDPKFYAIRILDGSNQEHEREANRELAAIHGIDYGCYDSAIFSGYKRLIAGCELIQTDYVQFVPDDDYFSEPAMRDHVELLDRNPAAVAAFGQIISFREVNSLGDSNHHLHVRFPVSENRIDYTFDQPITNIFYSMFERSRAAYYSLYRSEIFLRSLQIAQESAVIAAPPDAKRGNSLVDPRCYYFGDLVLTIIPLIHGKKINSGLASVGYQTGQSFDTSGNAKKNDVPERMAHHRLLLDESFDFKERANRFIDAMITEYTAVHPGADKQTLREFFTDLTLAFFGTLASGAKLLRTYNDTCKHLNVPEEMWLRTAAAVKTPCEIYSLPHHSNEKNSDDLPIKGQANQLHRFKFVLDDISEFYNCDRIRAFSIENGKLEVARSLFSYERPNPYGVKSNRPSSIQASPLKSTNIKFTRRFFKRAAGKISRMIQPYGFRSR